MKEKDLDYEAYGCWCCGEIMGLTATDVSTDEVYCGECGEAGIVTLEHALEVMNNMYEEGKLYPYSINGHDELADDGGSDDDDTNYNQ